MKGIAIFLIAGSVLSQNANAVGVNLLKTKEVKKVGQSKVNKDEVLLKRLIENNQRMTELLEMRSMEPVIWDHSSRIQAGKVYRGLLLNTIVSTNLASPILIEAYPEQGLPFRTKFLCQGNTQHKRVHALCGKMITQHETKTINAQILNLDGSSGLVGEYEDGKDQLIAGAVLSDFSQGMMSAAQARIAGPFGAIRDDSVGNQLLQGAIQSGRATSEILLDEMKRVEPVVTVEAGSEVLVFFTEGLNE